ncbi:hypothetical protein DB345_05350 [Spartobacteria bacterium LR76]|nr:hypothetical protein DB345_05350 [Spartobacteria bacterium LR76]
MFAKPLPHFSKPARAFSLIEVVLALGIVSFAMMAVVGTLPVGLRSAQQSRSQIAAANIARQIQGDLQQISFESSSSDDLTIATLPDNPFYFSQDGTRSQERDAYYVASFTLNAINAPGLSVNSSNARSVKVSISYPASVAKANRQEVVYSLLLAKQKND